MRTRSGVVALLMLCWAAAASAAQTDASDPDHRMFERRAVEAAIWGMPAVNAELMFQAAAGAGAAGLNQVVFWSRPLTWKNQTLTPNPDTIYLMPMYNTRDAGPIVLEIPPPKTSRRSPAASTMRGKRRSRTWTCGRRQGEGWQISHLPPEYREKMPEGYIALPSPTYAGYALLRSNLKSARRLRHCQGCRIWQAVRFYPLSQAANPPETRYVDARRPV